MRDGFPNINLAYYACVEIYVVDRAECHERVRRLLLTSFAVRAGS